ncbi:SDR family NAD(P)-dependent oxidoreductase [Nocardia yamanashiensis]|uniref:SDR family NAD(P)-dependent oxidoreductase n=1 Tax=Nocardia yamanashiensis TaxID=209247 RepID=UPI001E4B59B4|nr:SDR family NAD(P)-dependent oxidoreductase [Nocardia yamanashiensis]UGT44806.1 SDR family NAD(P)-dependent oxidoreductase [Nocardia yamanashiensis]
MAGQDLAGKTVVVTGASSGIGAAAAARLAERGATVAVVGRSPERTAAVAEKVGGAAFTADFANFEQVRALAAQLLERYPRIDVLANNAGGAWAERTVTVDGNELTFQANHLSPFLLTNLLLERLLASDARVINTSSTTYRMARLDLGTVNASTGSFNQLAAYAQSKLVNLIFTRELARRTAGTGLRTAAFHPGAVATHVYDNAPLGLGALIRSPLGRLVFLSPERGAEPLVHLATTAEDIGGKYFHRLKVEQPKNKQALDTALAQELWTLSEKLTGVTSAAS